MIVHRRTATERVVARASRGHRAAGHVDRNRPALVAIGRGGHRAAIDVEGVDAIATPAEGIASRGTEGATVDSHHAADDACIATARGQDDATRIDRETAAEGMEPLEFQRTRAVLLDCAATRDWARGWQQGCRGGVEDQRSASGERDAARTTQNASWATVADFHPATLDVNHTREGVVGQDRQATGSRLGKPSAAADPRTLEGVGTRGVLNRQGGWRNRAHQAHRRLANAKVVELHDVEVVELRGGDAIAAEHPVGGGVDVPVAIHVALPDDRVGLVDLHLNDGVGFVIHQLALEMRVGGGKAQPSKATRAGNCACVVNDIKQLRERCGNGIGRQRTNFGRSIHREGSRNDQLVRAGTDPEISRATSQSEVGGIGHSHTSDRAGTKNAAG